MAEQSKAKSAPRRTQQKFVRNLRNVHVSLRLGEDAGKRKIELAPRGQRNDYAILKKGDQSDPQFIANKDMLFEIITEEEANEIAAKQSTNAQEQRRHPALANIRNELGGEYENDSIKLDPQENEDLGVVVAETREVAEGVGDVIIDRRVGIRRANVPGSEDKSVPDVPDSISPEEQAAYRLDQEAKEAASLDDLGLKVSKDPVQKS